ncbi:hypothetical protein J2S43_000125 [Catenuloplanes nepalensis]|uniref:PatA-like N-terminal domain-containing protein n=1 Tax=Catenuloplanes nepalensis TaxID=587533 RepID=A0ABT9MJZ7_9ACTN|nr:DUF4388 domain-containing protein [Catenuloplanes nepalensis]MDP9791613.1 hypothetical protein [Catenuloplanes nepalensis]
MKPARAAQATLPRRALSQLVNAGETGALHVAGHPGGVIHLTEGRVSHAESPAAPGVGELLIASGRISARTWESAVAAGKDAHRVGRLLVERGHLTNGELELCVLGVIYDAAYFVLQPAAVPVRFAEGEQHWLGPVCRVDADVLSRETTRRRRLLDEVFQSSTLDTAPVRPAPRPPVERVVLSSLQFELLVAADGERTPATLARLLGRAGYVTLQQVRELAAAGLIMTEDRAPAAPADAVIALAEAAIAAAEHPTVPAQPGIPQPGIPTLDIPPQDIPPLGPVKPDPPNPDLPTSGAAKPHLPKRDDSKPAIPNPATTEQDTLQLSTRQQDTRKQDISRQDARERAIAEPAPDERRPATGGPEAPTSGPADVPRPAGPVRTARPGRATTTAAVEPPATADDTAPLPSVSPPENPADPEKPAKPRRTTGGRRRAGARAGAAIPTENLPRRSPGEQMPSGAGDVQTAPDGGPLRGDAPDEALLTRIRSALKALR